MLTMMPLRQLLGAVLSGGLFQYYFLSFLVMSSACRTSFLNHLFHVTLLAHAPLALSTLLLFPGAQGRGSGGDAAMGLTNINISKVFYMQDVIHCNCWLSCSRQR